jgi:hypothetical protein
MLDQHDPTKGRSQEYDKPGQEAQDGGEHGEQFKVRGFFKGFRFYVLRQAFTPQSVHCTRCQSLQLPI